MPNLIRFERGSYYHIYNRGNNRETIFRSDENYRFFLKRYIHYLSPVATTYSYCLMPNHFHALIYLLTEEEQRDHLDAIPPEWQPMGASRAFAKLFTSYAMAFNKMWGRTGSLFTKSLARKRVGDDAYFTQLVRYIHRNPQKHGFVDDFREWKWSSYTAVLTPHPSRIPREELLDWFGGRHQFADAHDVAVDDHLIEPVLLEDWI